MVNGVAQATGVAIDVTAAQLGPTAFQSGSGTDDLWVRASDGISWSAWKAFHVAAPVKRSTGGGGGQSDPLPAGRQCPGIVAVQRQRCRRRRGSPGTSSGTRRPMRRAEAGW